MAYSKPDYFTLYKASFPNGKVYIGLTSRHLKDRIAQHKLPSQNKTGRPMYRALKKYGDAVIWETILTFDKKEHVQQAEEAFIQLYKSNLPDFGYNITTGGESNYGIKRPELKVKIIDNSGNIFNGYEEAMNYYNFTRAQIRCSIVSGSYCGLVYFSLYKPGMVKAEARTVTNKYKRKVFDEKNQIVFLSVKDACEYHGITQAKLASMNRSKKCTLKYFEGIK
jgi:hypothetical protein